jgi:hypothetical protein
MSLYSFQGKVWAGERLSNGKLGRPVWAGNVPTLSLKTATETSNKTESFSGNRLQYGRLQKGKTATLDVTFDEWLPQNIALAIWASQLNVAAATVTGETFPNGLVAGDYVNLDNPFVSNLVITDSAAQPATVATSKYLLESPNAGLVKLTDVANFTQPFKAAYGYASRQSFTMFTAAPPERYILLDGINTETGEAVIVKLYRCKFDPVADLSLINDDYGNFSLTGSVLYDVVNAANANLGGFGRIDQKAA